METRETFYFDTYAVFELIAGNKNYEKYAKSNIVLSKLNMFELYYSLLRDFSGKVAMENFKKYFGFVHDFDATVLVKAATFKLFNKKHDLSMVDCIGYFISRMLGIKFLTGDEKFRNMPNVEFVK